MGAALARTARTRHAAPAGLRGRSAKRRPAVWFGEAAQTSWAATDPGLVDAPDTDALLPALWVGTTAPGRPASAGTAGADGSALGAPSRGRRSRTRTYAGASTDTAPSGPPSAAQRRETPLLRSRGSAPYGSGGGRRARADPSAPPHPAVGTIALSGSAGTPSKPPRAATGRRVRMPVGRPGGGASRRRFLATAERTPRATPKTIRKPSER
ncbi:hypothetical protein GCM10023224_14660 [Streptomonospora halophila]|uniref:Uncharacterized protein n=1 Tax=Streptomonospora halophila TaxID=427369 RepID=A0ABP9GIV8_9ACTN